MRFREFCAFLKHKIPSEGSGPQKEVALAGLPYEVKISGPQKEVALAGLPYEVQISGPQKEVALAGLPYE